MASQVYQVNRSEDGSFLAITDTYSGMPSVQKFSASVESLLTLFCGDVPAVLEDLIDVAVTAYVTDRAIRRRPPSGESGSLLWQRDLELHIPVTEPDKWNQSVIKELLSDALGCLTEDRWKFSFHPRKHRRPLQRVLCPPGSPIKAALFSGGLDSLAGLAVDLENLRGETLLSVTCVTGRRLMNKQRKILRSLRKEHRDRFVPIIAPVRLVQTRKAYNDNEPTQRARGFLFCILGAVAALLGGADELSIYENGVGAINLPLSEAQLGAQSSKATNPVALRKIEELISALLGRAFSLRLPYIFSTKGQMCEALSQTAFKSLALDSISCDSFPLRISGPEQCGICSSCLLRRQALWTSKFREDLQEGRYRYDVFSESGLREVSKLGPWWDMLGQVERFDGALGISKNPWASLTIEFPELMETADVLGSAGSFSAGLPVKQRLLALFKNYSREWHDLPAYPKGWKFSDTELQLSA
jgi:hypothetical protein